MKSQKFIWLAGFISIFLFLFILNFFSIIPLYQINPMLQGLPRMNKTTNDTSDFSNINVSTEEAKKDKKEIISPNSIKKFIYKNDTTKYKVFPIPQSSIKVLSGLTISIDLTIRYKSDDAKTDSSSSGFQFDNNLKAPDSRKIFLFYVPNRVWGMQFQNGSSSQVYPFMKRTIADNEARGRFTFSISADGTIVNSELPLQRKLTLPTSLYQPTNQMSGTVLVAPNTEVEIISLSYTQK